MPPNPDAVMLPHSKIYLGEKASDGDGSAIRGGMNAAKNATELVLCNYG
jgi:hypothetical protein